LGAKKWRGKGGLGGGTTERKCQRTPKVNLRAKLLGNGIKKEGRETATVKKRRIRHCNQRSIKIGRKRGGGKE